ncbi:gluconate 2-dehydrogenase subunit 3 family protein [Gluconobacter morbifer]|uniref:Gluconate 2-dehydrogenase subunit 3 family protein n=1 Tax=Gluconobacter morbifer G707 TaxID=1088869 RepID=G6XKE1_9PROT|nr:gluconate 2-dehydrogenase subunit 3 family protein [Gluconobacter morbifer]EHH67737.1 hypothetical protein GMO_19570 [Gluconobacter morbifer G707]
MTTPPESPAFLTSDHISHRTRNILLSRMEQETLSRPEVLSLSAFAVLDALIPVLLPQDSVLPGHPLNLAVRIDRALAGPRDGWRFAELPPDAQAWEAALLTLDDVSVRRHGMRVLHLAADLRGELLDDLLAGTIGLQAKGRLTPAQMQRWSGDLRADVVECFLSDPTVQAALGISANLTGGDDIIQGFHSVSPDSREDFEPSPTAPVFQD